MKRKRISIQQVMERKSLNIIDNIIPENWVIHQYGPDFGIDLSIEVFEKINDSLSEALGEHFFVQVKSIYKPNIKSIKSRGAKPTNIKVIKYSLDARLIRTINAMGSGAPVLLFIVVLDSSYSGLYFLCLNDYIDKIILKYQRYVLENNQESMVLNIPLTNKLDKLDIGALRFYAKRAKLYNAFINFYQQYIELQDIGIDRDELSDEKKRLLVITVKEFLLKNANFDIWKESDVIASHLIQEIQQSIEEIKNHLVKLKDEKSNWEETFEEFRFSTKYTWDKMRRLSSSYEEVCRKYWLPINE
ncbi:hypothetical protein BHL47_19715 [Bacillus cereus]|uniref:DUF4365 domain-containing protein n=1 Tax=Bacillus cereus TaxID=1396 RepID=UPI000994FDE3|nr:DUF4365 domain-containing protein [Bacillus cereus]OPA28157.1 hypothetical protein BHL47_19715 [Bacillus cereus]